MSLIAFVTGQMAVGKILDHRRGGQAAAGRSTVGQSRSGGRKIAGLRDILIHAYFDIDTDIIWDVVSNERPALDAQVRRILES